MEYIGIDVHQSESQICRLLADPNYTPNTPPATAVLHAMWRDGTDDPAPPPFASPHAPVITASPSSSAG